MPTIGTSTGSSSPSDPAGSGPSTSTARTPAAESSLTTSGVVGTRRQQRRRACDPAVPLGVEEPVERVALGDRDDLATREGDDGRLDHLARAERAAERRLTRREHAEPRPEQDVCSGAAPARVGRRDSERAGGAAGRGDAAVRRPRGAVVPGGCDDEGAEGERAARRARERAVRERRERLHYADERDAGGVVRVAVGVRVDGGLQAGEQLVGAAVDGDACPRRPAATPRRGSGAMDAPGATPWSPSGPRDPATRPASSVPCRSGRPGSVGFCSAEASLPGSSSSMPGTSARWRYGWRVSTPVSRSATVIPVPSNPGQRHGDARVGALLEEVRVDGRVRQCRRIDGPHGVDTRDARVALERREQPRIDRGGEAVQDSDVRLLGIDRRAVEREPRDRPLLRVARSRGPGTHLALGRAAACTRHAIGQGRRLQDDDPPSSELRERPAAEQPLPAGGAAGIAVRCARGAARSEREDDGERGAHRRQCPCATRTRTHRAQGTRARRRGRANRAAEAIIAALSVQRASGAKRASGSAARSSEFAATPPTTATVRCPRLLGSSAQSADERPHDGVLVRGSESRHRRASSSSGARSRTAYRSAVLRPEKEKSRPGDARDRERERLGVTLARQLVELGPARVAEPEQPSALVERLAGGIVDRRAQHLEP